MSLEKSIFACVMAGLGGVLTGCDPGGPGAIGSVSLGRGVDASAFKTLTVFAIADTGAAFDPAHPAFSAPTPESSEPWLPKTDDLKSVTFPHAYEVGPLLGTTFQERWRVFAWLSPRAESANASATPAPGDAYGTAAFAVASCGVFFREFCEKTTGVDITIDQKVP